MSPLGHLASGFAAKPADPELTAAGIVQERPKTATYRQRMSSGAKLEANRRYVELLLSHI